MVDSNDRDRVSEARDELHRMLSEVCLVQFSMKFQHSDFARAVYRSDPFLIVG